MDGRTKNYGFYQQPLPIMAAKTAISLQNRTDNVTFNNALYELTIGDTRVPQLPLLRTGHITPLPSRKMT